MRGPLLLIGPLVTSLPAGEYFASAETWRFVWRNVLVRWEIMLPGVFLANALPGFANGSLWTLEFEVECYAVILGLGLLRGLSKYRILTPWLLSLIASAFWFASPGGSFRARSLAHKSSPYDR